MVENTKTALKPEPIANSEPTFVKKPCPGLTEAFNSQIGYYLRNTMVEGAGSRSKSHYAQDMYRVKFKNLEPEEQESVNLAVIHGCTWCNISEPNHMAVFASGEQPCLKFVDVEKSSQLAPTPCENCLILFNSCPFQKTIKRKRAEGTNMKYIPTGYTCPNLAQVYSRYRQLEGLMEEAKDNNQSLAQRFVHHTLAGNFKDSKVFLGIVEAMILAKDRELSGKSMSNFKYTPAFDDFMHVMHMLNPRAYREMSRHIKMWTEQSIRYVPARLSLGSSMTTCSVLFNSQDLVS
ncbi:hypothetical protein K435DRAFT_664202 [Dendrothele bispora CBS 962.96]|uniref:Uncharacterized protein n=1 Tax=Dendrothele bispora (strain CBS 962.96) TaxID=1314807 RepID=A0A4S8M321_DENBC|nr:hypothetical protein K435DRAFT_664202 [Dendrothele bispora CBS 962.96]